MGKITDILHRNRNLVQINDSWTRERFKDMADCGTGRLGTTSYICSHCKAIEHINASCGSRNCPSCGGAARAKWVKEASDRLFPVKHFHAVFTLPHVLNGLIGLHKNTMLNLLMNTVAETLMQFSKKTFGGTPAFMMVLHSWTQELEPHYHVHVLFSSGYFAEEKWKSHNKKFLFPVLALSSVFRAKFLSHLSKMVKNPKNPMFEKSIPTVPEKWVVYCAPPYSGANTAVKYFGQYANRVGISDSRILSVSDGIVEIALKRDNAEKEPAKTAASKGSNQNKKSIKISELEFANRLSTHILPKGFRKIRYFGLYSPRSKMRKIVRASLEKIKVGKGVGAVVVEFKKCSVCEIGVLCFLKRNKLRSTGPPL